ncbi:MAG: ABC transporter ATP-binding protein [Christensenellales bacterium]|jgi:iron complex transport system ATP-binding protein
MLEVKDLYCGYGQGDVVKGVGFSLKKGEVLCLSGPNGCGKTTLLRAVSALLPYTGKVKICGKNIATMKRAQIASKAALLSQQSSIYFPYTVYETVMMGRYLHMKKGFFPSHTVDDRRCALECIELVGLSDFVDRKITELSGGQFQRVMLARVFAQEPSVILLDEPTNHLDIKNQVETVEHIRNWVKVGERAALAVFHDINLTMAAADRVLLMDDGKITRDGTVSDVLSGEEISIVYGMDVGAYMRKILSIW